MNEENNQDFDDFLEFLDFLDFIDNISNVFYSKEDKVMMKTVLADFNGKTKVYREDCFQGYNSRIRDIRYKGGKVLKVWDEDVSNREVDQYLFYLKEEGKR